MKKELITFALIMIFLQPKLFGQNILLNGNFEDQSSGCKNPKDNAPEDFDLEPFYDNKVGNWNSSHGTAQITHTRCNNTTFDNLVYNGNSSAFMSWSTGNKEGIYHPISIKKDESFNISFVARGWNDSSKIIIKFTSGIQNNHSQVLPSPANSQTLFEISLTANWQEFSLDEVIANANYSQIWIYAENGLGIFLDDLAIYKS